MKPTIATIFNIENTYSTAPNTFTLTELMPISAAENPTIQYQPGTAGNQYFIYTAIAVTSVPTANTIDDQYA
ncbi:hypothetical protein KCU90_g8112, partial [Aureobasidium melanogenum]